MEPERKYRHGKANRQLRSFRLPGELVDRLKKEPNQTAVIVKALDAYYKGKCND
jgi:hypothetical protein